MSIRERNRRRTHDHIYESAMSLFVAKGFEDVTVDEICESAGISKATFFRYFENKFGLVNEFNMRIAAKIDAAIDPEEMSGAQCLRIATETMYEEWLHSAPQMRSLAFEFIRTQTRQTTDPVAKGMIRTLIKVVESAQRRGEFCKDLEPRLVAGMIVFAWTSATLAWFDRNDEDGFNRSIRGLVELQIAGLTTLANAPPKTSAQRKRQKARTNQERRGG